MDVGSKPLGHPCPSANRQHIPHIHPYPGWDPFSIGLETLGAGPGVLGTLDTGGVLSQETKAPSSTTVACYSLLVLPSSPLSSSGFCSGVPGPPAASFLVGEVETEQKGMVGLSWQPRAQIHRDFIKTLQGQVQISSGPA